MRTTDFASRPPRLSEKPQRRECPLPYTLAPEKAHILADPGGEVLKLRYCWLLAVVVLGVGCGKEEHDEAVKRLQDWIKLPSIAAENLNSVT